MGTRFKIIPVLGTVLLQVLRGRVRSAEQEGAEREDNKNSQICCYAIYILVYIQQETALTFKHS